MTKFPHVSLAKTGKNINRLMIEKNLTVKDVQDACGFEYPQAVYKWLRGECLPTVDNLVVLALLFNVKIDTLVVIEQ
jgi:transcriptional regulator with XRE-family HTH domain